MKELINVKEIIIKFRDWSITNQITSDYFVNVSEDFLNKDIWISMFRRLQTIEGTTKIEYPADWWQAVKHRFASKWFIRKYPIVMNVIHAEAIFPESQLTFPESLGKAQFMLFVDCPKVSIEDFEYDKYSK
jgi:hypothetical protein